MKPKIILTLVDENGKVIDTEDILSFKPEISPESLQKAFDVLADKFTETVHEAFVQVRSANSVNKTVN